MNENQDFTLEQLVDMVTFDRPIMESLADYGYDGVIREAKIDQITRFVADHRAPIEAYAYGKRALKNISTASEVVESMLLRVGYGNQAQRVELASISRALVDAQDDMVISLSRIGKVVQSVISQIAISPSDAAATLGHIRSPLKAKKSAANGKLGGRPRKQQ